MEDTGSVAVIDDRGVGPKTALDKDLPYPLSCSEYLQIISDSMTLRNDVQMLTSLVTEMIRKFQRQATRPI